MVSNVEGKIITLAEARLALEELPRDLEKEVKIPFILEHRRLAKPGRWNGLAYDGGVLREAFETTDWSDPKNRALYSDHPENQQPGTSNPTMWIGEVRNLSHESDGIYGDLVVVDKQMAMKLAFGAKFGISPSFFGGEPVEGRIPWAKFQNFALVLEPAIEGNYVNGKIVNQYYNSVNGGENMEKQEEKKIEPDPLAEDLKTIYGDFKAKYAEEHPDAKDFDVTSAFNKAIKEAFKKKEEEASKKSEEKPKKKEQPKDEDTSKDKVPPTDKTTEAIEKLGERLSDDLAKKVEALEKKLEEKEKNSVEKEPPKPEKKTKPNQEPKEDIGGDIDERMVEYLDKMREKNAIKM